MKFSNKLSTLLLYLTVGTCFFINSLFFALFNNNHSFLKVIIIVILNFFIIITTIFVYKYIDKKFSELYINFERDKKLIYKIFNKIEKSKSESISKEINITKDKSGMVSIYIIKKSKNKFKKSSEDMIETINLENKLSDAIDNNELISYYQPIYDVKEDRIVAAESLIRWITEDEVIQPNDFIPIAKRNGEILRIDEFVLKGAVKQCKEIIDLGEKDFIITVNISHLILKQFNFIEKLISIVNEGGISPRNIKLEITEDETIDDTEFTVNILNKLRNIGFSIALDDFGVGYSSFNHIKTLPLDSLKIDRSLLISLEKDNKTLSIVETLINLAHTLELEVICEGVEIKEQMNLLKSIKCDKIQGYYISKPLCKKDFKEFLIKFNKIKEERVIN